MGKIIYSLLLTEFAVTGCYDYTLAFEGLISMQQSTWMEIIGWHGDGIGSWKLVAGHQSCEDRQHWVVVEDHS